MNRVQSAVRLYRNGGIPHLFHGVFSSFLSGRFYFSRLPPKAVWIAYGLGCRVLPDVSDANPVQLRYVDPEDIEYYHEGKPLTFGAVMDGDWDNPQCRFEETSVYRSLEMRFDYGTDWNTTPLYQEYADRIGSDDPYWRCETIGELIQYFEGIDELYRTIRKNGYRPQRDLLKDRPRQAVTNPKDTPHPIMEEICVNIYRDGSLAKKRGGTHRLAIAKLLNLSEIPILVRVRHADWQRIRDEIRSAESIDELSDRAYRHLDHPDLTDISIAR